MGKNNKKGKQDMKWTMYQNFYIDVVEARCEFINSLRTPYMRGLALSVLRTGLEHCNSDYVNITNRHEKDGTLRNHLMKHFLSFYNQRQERLQNK